MERGDKGVVGWKSKQLLLRCKVEKNEGISGIEQN